MNFSEFILSHSATPVGVLIRRPFTRGRVSHAKKRARDGPSLELLLGRSDATVDVSGVGSAAPGVASGFDELACCGEQGSGDTESHDGVGSSLTLEVVEKIVHYSPLGRVLLQGVFYTRISPEKREPSITIVAMTIVIR